MSFTKNIQHITFATKSRRPAINAAHRRDLYRVRWDILKKLGVHVHRIGGVGDHGHVLCDIPSKHSIAEVLRQVKGVTSRWMKQSGFFSDVRRLGGGVFFVFLFGRGNTDDYGVSQKPGDASQKSVVAGREAGTHHPRRGDPNILLEKFYNHPPEAEATG